MTENDDLAGEIAIGYTAAAVIESEAYKQAFATLEQELVEAWKKTNVSGKEGQADREKLFLMSRLLSKVQINLESLMQNGQMARQNLSLLQKAQQAVGSQISKQPWNV